METFGALKMAALAGIRFQVKQLAACSVGLVSLIQTVDGPVILRVKSSAQMTAALRGVYFQKPQRDDPHDSLTCPQQISFIDESHGWVIGTFSIWRTEDGGKSWIRVSPGNLC